MVPATGLEVSTCMFQANTFLTPAFPRKLPRPYEFNQAVPPNQHFRISESQ